MDGGGNLAGKEKEFFDPRAGVGVCVWGRMCTLVSLHMMEIATQHYLPGKAKKRKSLGPGVCGVTAATERSPVLFL